MNDETRPPEYFAQAYRGQPAWDVGHAQPALVEIAPRVAGSVLDVGCGTGDNAIFFAQRGHMVYGIDVVDEALARAKAKAADQGADVCFVRLDALTLNELPMLFDNVVDCGLFHVFSDEDRPRYVQALAGVLRPGGCLWLLCFSDLEPPGRGPRRVSLAELQAAFADGWNVLSITRTRFATSSHVPPGAFSQGGPHAYLAEIKRQD
jgi:cyclopropane fatty-acyl-phospholipid synthase-like methyltransferase